MNKSEENYLCRSMCGINGVNHTTHDLISLSDRGSAAVIKLFPKPAKNGRKRGSVIIDNERWSYFETYADAKAFQAMLFLHGGQS